jgi:hypothetical protein
LSLAQITRLIRAHAHRESGGEGLSATERFAAKYTPADVALCVRAFSLDQ